MDWTAESFRDEFRGCPWFANVGTTLSLDPAGPIRRVGSWESAVINAAHGNCWWCANEASNLLADTLHDRYRQEYQSWNRHVDEFERYFQTILAAVTSRIPAPFRDSKAADWIRTVLCGAYLECAFGALSDVRLSCDFVAWFLRGRFPCGWTVEDPSEFPDRALIIVF
jgi:hypothetical protein